MQLLLIASNELNENTKSILFGGGATAVADRCAAAAARATDTAVKAEEEVGGGAGHRMKEFILLSDYLQYSEIWKCNEMYGMLQLL